MTLYSAVVLGLVAMLNFKEREVEILPFLNLLIFCSTFFSAFLLLLSGRLPQLYFLTPVDFLSAIIFSITFILPKFHFRSPDVYVLFN